MRGCRLKLCLVAACVCAQFLACGDDASSTGAERSETASSAVELSSAMLESSSSATPESSEGMSSSISDSVSSSSSFGTPPTQPDNDYYEDLCLRKSDMSRDLWEGTTYRVSTCEDNGTETSGYWYVFSDQQDGGNSSIEWPVETDVMLGDDLGDGLNPVIEACGGVCGTFKLDAGEMKEEPFVGIAFNVAGREKGESGKPYGEALDVADVVKWGAICITYSVDVKVKLELSMGRARDSALVGFDLPYVTLPKCLGAPEDVCFAWSRFKQGGWGTDQITGEEVAKNLATIRFKIQGEDGTTGRFDVKGIWHP